ncbi:WxL protein peptidoglycan domain-containing protein [Erysipelothrix anatis]|uniref:WxL protein peptidoglycan domain-containing protein n=1 Tax=Erysipelothrix anatis TaxID=2683713 RepID=UPI00135A014F|nr:DUF916 domain-containing protein [Erysipelothrix anatis]
MNRTKNICLAIILAVSIVVGIKSIRPESYDKFTVLPSFPENQTNPHKSYFDIDVKTNTQQTLTIDITNQGDLPLIASINIVDASTSDNAQLQFNSSEPDTSLLIPITSFTSVREEYLEIAPHSTEKAYIDIDTDGVEFEGARLAGINVSGQIVAQGIDFPSNEPVTYTVPLQMQMTYPSPPLNLNYVKTETEMFEHNIHFASKIQNSKPIYMNGVSFHGIISDTQSRRVVGMVDIKNGAIAPNSSFKVIYVGNHQPIEAGDYTVDLEIKHESNVWKFRDSYTVTEEEAESAKEEVANLDFKAYVVTWVLISIAGIMLCLIIYLFWRKHRENI